MQLVLGRAGARWLRRAKNPNARSRVASYVVTVLRYLPFPVVLVAAAGLFGCGRDHPTAGAQPAPSGFVAAAAPDATGAYVAGGGIEPPGRDSVSDPGEELPEEGLEELDQALPPSQSGDPGSQQGGVQL